MPVSQGNLDNPAADKAPGTQQTSAAPAKRTRVAWLLGAVAISLYLGSIVWFYFSRGAGA